ncbi:hypothetical protein ACN9MY_06220 [Pseudoduganella sp. R-31]|uniref:hypothetical protein n=1 Tax=Pseudoduganella sp. R-31 TaxID=3404060 RepID=UPI003CF52243
MTSKLFLTASKDSSQELTSLFDFVWPTSAAIWNMQWQVKGYRAQMPTATPDEMGARFTSGSGIQNVNFKQLEQASWSDMQGWFAKLLLSESCALFEGWIASALDELKVPDTVRKRTTKSSIDKQLQFPSEIDASGSATKGLQKGLASLHASGKSAALQASFQAPLMASRKNASSHIEKLLVCYRVFKEARNCFTHHGGRANQKTVDAYSSYATETPVTLGLKEKPIMPPITVVGSPIELSLRGVVGFSDVVFRLIHTLDAEFAVSSYAEQVFASIWTSKHPTPVTLKSIPAKRHTQLKGMVHACGLPRPTSLASLDTYMQNQGLVI